jgi:hypothetical protein
MSPKKPIKRAASAKRHSPTDGKQAKKGKKDKEKVKVIRDSFTMPQTDYARIAELKEACLGAGLHVKKSELLRAGLIALSKLRTAQLKRMIIQLEHVKTGRPKKQIVKPG